ncbi:hypothetical protein AeMF1_009677 [Aphanomyces euteiches]|nr:hypothetical protein AeMF1_009677 [Aphanomyces euteiches]KAH9195712.1 hypothetical protein AeNC1_002314 [Aphanomyces euteiches]
MSHPTTPPSSSDRNPRRAARAWTAHEDRLLTLHATTPGTKQWKEVASFIPGRTAKQCRERWQNHLRPGIHRSPWTDVEDERIITLQAEYGNRWALIASHLGHRSANAVKNRWYSNLSMRPTMREAPPSTTEPNMQVYDDIRNGNTVAIAAPLDSSRSEFWTNFTDIVLGSNSKETTANQDDLNSSEANVVGWAAAIAHGFLMSDDPSDSTPPSNQ